MRRKSDKNQEDTPLGTLLQNSVTAWENLTRHSENNIMVLDPDGTILFINHGINGLNPDELIGTTLTSHLTAEDEIKARGVMESVLVSGSPDQFQVSHGNSQAEIKNYINMVHPITEQDKIIALVIEERNVLEQLNFRLLDTILSQSPIILWAIDRNGTIVLSEGQGLSKLGQKNNEVVGHSIFELYRNNKDILHDIDCAMKGQTVSSVSAIEERTYRTYYNPVYDKGNKIKLLIGFAYDITEFKHLEEQKAILSSALEQTAELVMITDVNGIIQFVNPAFEKITGYSRDSVIGKKPNILRSEKQDDKIYSEIWSTLLRGEVFNGVIINKRKDNTHYYEEKTITPLRNEQNQITHYIATGKDISERMRTQERLHYMAHHDALTKLPNRTLFMDRLRQAMARARWHNRLIAIMFMDLDRFKNINDTLGHNTGDRLLVQLTQRFSDSIRAGDTVARLGGDEFAIILDDIASEKDVSQLAKKLLDTLAPAFKLENQELFVTASIGVSIFPNDGEDSDTLLRNADIAMYRAKDLGRNNYQFYSNEMSARAFKRLAMENSLRHALKRRELFLLYQPIFDLKTRKIHSVEALLRWQHPDLGIIQPSDFVPILEETGLISEVGTWVLHKACNQAYEWHKQGYGFLGVSVNLSGRQFNDPDFIHSIQNIINVCHIEPTLLELELTESLLMRNASKTIAALEMLSKTGIGIAVDDFGTGYSSLSYLRRFQITTLKIDQSFIRDVSIDPDDAAITTAIIVMAKSLNLNVVAEGVETEEQITFLQNLNCNLVQGYYFSPPVTAETITQLLQ